MRLQSESQCFSERRSTNNEITVGRSPPSVGPQYYTSRSSSRARPNNNRSPVRHKQYIEAEAHKQTHSRHQPCRIVRNHWPANRLLLVLRPPPPSIRQFQQAPEPPPVIVSTKSALRQRPSIRALSVPRRWVFRPPTCRRSNSQSNRSRRHQISDSKQRRRRHRSSIQACARTTRTPATALR